MAERLVIPATNLHVVPDTVPEQEACFVEPLAAACRILEQQVPSRQPPQGLGYPVVLYTPSSWNSRCPPAGLPGVLGTQRYLTPFFFFWGNSRWPPAGLPGVLVPSGTLHPLFLEKKVSSRRCPHGIGYPAVPSTLFSPGG